MSRTRSSIARDADGVDDVRLLLDDGTAILLDAELDTNPDLRALAEQLGRAPWPRLRIVIGGREPRPLLQP